MKRNRMLLFCVASIMVLSLVFAGCPPPDVEPDPDLPPVVEPIVLKAVSFMYPGHPVNHQLEWFIEQVEERSDGELIIDYLGGHEVIPTFDQMEALMDGVVDMLNSPGCYMTGIVPSVELNHLAEYEPWVDRETGFYDFQVGEWKEVGVRFLGQVGGGYSTAYYLFTNERPETPQDLAGQVMRTNTYDPFMKALGIERVTMPGGDIYLAMEHGTIDGFGWPIYAGFIEMGLAEVTKYAIDHSFWRGDIMLFMNLDSYNKLPSHLRDLVDEVAAETEIWAVEYYAEIHDWQREEAMRQGVEFIKFSEADAEWYLDLANEAMWESEMERMKASPQFRAELEAMLKAP